MNTTIKRCYATMPQRDFDAFIAIIEANGVSNSLAALSDFITQTNFGDTELSFTLGKATGIAHKFKKAKAGA